MISPSNDDRSAGHESMRPSQAPGVKNDTGTRDSRLNPLAPAAERTPSHGPYLRAQEVFLSIEPGNAFADRHRQTVPNYQERAVCCIYGGAGTGKGTISSDLAQSLGIGYIDSGAIFRTVALVAQREGYSANEAGELLTPSRTPISEDRNAQLHLVRIASELPIRFAEVANSSIPAVYLETGGMTRYEDVSKLIRTGISPDVLAAVAGNRPLQQTIFKFIQEITPDNAIVEGRENIANQVFEFNEFKTVIELTAQANVVAARRLAQVRTQETGQRTDWHRILHDPKEQEALTEMSLQIMRRDARDKENVSGSPGVPVYNLDTTTREVKESVKRLSGPVNKMLKQWDLALQAGRIHTNG